MTKIRAHVIHLLSLASAASIAASCTVDGVSPSVTGVSDEAQASASAGERRRVGGSRSLY
jgi:hypothetical protein